MLYCNKYYVTLAMINYFWWVGRAINDEIIAMNNNDDGGLSPGFPCIAIVDR